MLIGLYSPSPQSGKSTVTRILAEDKVFTVFKVSGAMKAMSAAAISGLVDDIESYVDGAHKDTSIPALTQDTLLERAPAMADALIDSSAGTLLEDSNGNTLSRDRLIEDLKTVFVPAALSLGQKDGITPRDIQKILGLEWGRQLYGFDFWLKPLAAALEASKTPLNIIDDVRYPDDGQFVADRDGIMVKIIRPSAENPDGHASEGLLEDFPFDLVFVNDSDLETFDHNIREQLLPLLEM